MQVYKFGGASVKDAAAVRNVAAILKENAGNEMVVVISAMGKTTNELEGVIQRFYAGDAAWVEALASIFAKHEIIINELGNDATMQRAKDDVRAIVSRVQSFLEGNTSRHFNFIYDQVVSAGEYISTTIVSAYANGLGLRNTLLDAKRCIFTDNAYTEGKVDFNKTETAINSEVKALLPAGFIVTQGFIGCTPENFTTTLGREGSDYTASIFAFALNAERMTVWKDVDGILNADPKEFPDAQLLSELTYHEAIEMTYYGASVIHPKTIKPIQNRNIPLEVRSFVNYARRGSVISANANTAFLPPIIIQKRGQSLLSFSAKDFSFIAEEHLTKLFGVVAENRLRVNMMQNAAISFSIVVDHKKEKLDNIVAALQNDFSITRNEGLSLLTIRHYNSGIIERLTKDKDILLRQVSRHTIQLLLRE